MAANSNIQVVYPSTPAQYFHLLRRQALRPIKKPLVVFTPKGLLRVSSCTSSWEELEKGQFQEILIDEEKPCKRLILCSGKIYYDLLAAKPEYVSLVRIEQLYPLHTEKLQKILQTHAGAEVVWVQEEPENMGAWAFLKPYLKGARYVGRPANATPATGSHKKHKQEQQELLDQAFGDV
jgi:2-oxoglutarate dehydrogenase E1 component